MPRPVCVLGPGWWVWSGPRSSSREAFDDITAVSVVDFVMQAGIVHRRPDA
ncbi:hypothetical protein AB0E77_31530 [Streptomyces sp. NPDC032940]|uniref:hypothetical protein n=1 Tax=Streptomyces sp. NPDC032940 TaxID=3155366 RepID=UPI0033BFC570